VVSVGLVIVTGALIGYHALTLTTPMIALEAIFFLQGAGMGIVMPTATESVMSVVPRERGGAGSAITNTSRQVAVALGVAVLGSILAQAYRARLEPALGVLPAAARAGATASIAATQAAAAQAGRSGPGLVAAADRAFVDAMHVTTVFSAVIAAVGAVLIAIWMPGLKARARAEALAPAATPPVRELALQPQPVLVEDAAI
jgi:hypothetical protein